MQNAVRSLESKWQELLLQRSHLAYFFFFEPSVHHLILSTTITMITLPKPGVVLCIKKNILAYRTRICRYLSDLSQILSNLHYQIHQIYLHDYLLDGPRSDGITGHACRLRMENIGGEADRAVDKRLCPWWYPQVGNEVNVFAALGDVGDVGVFSGHDGVPRIDDGSAGERYLSSCAFFA